MIYGGNVVTPLAIGKAGSMLLGQGEYIYRCHSLNEGDALEIADLQSFTVYIMELEAGTALIDELHGLELVEGDCLQAEATAVRLRCRGGRGCLLVSGTQRPSSRPAGATLTQAAGLYRVHKPWGHELWISGDHPNYCLKQIFINAGNQTSLQYHQKKQETNVLVSGSARLHFRSNQTVGVDHVTSADLDSVGIEPFAAIDVQPGVLHRLEAITDILLYETSTPHLDDVVRVQDDTERGDGRVAQEHNV